MNLMEALLSAKLGGGPSSVTPASVASAIHDMTDEQAAQALADLGGAAAVDMDYTISIPPTIYLKKDTEFCLRRENVLSPTHRLRFGNYSVLTVVRSKNEYISVTGTATGTVPMTVRVYDQHDHQTEQGQIQLSISDTPPASQTMLMMGDSFITQGYIEGFLRGLFTADSNTLTLIGTKGTGDNKHQGYAGWTYQDFLNASRGVNTNPFYNPQTEAFDFNYYLASNSLAAPDSVYVQLGTNDVGAGTMETDFSQSVAAALKIVESILAQNNSIKVYIGLCVMPTYDLDLFSGSYNGIGDEFVMRANMIRFNRAIIDAITSAELGARVRIVANNCILDGARDYNNAVHPSAAGYQKMAEQLYYTMGGWSN